MERIVDGNRLLGGRIIGFVYLSYFLIASVGAFLMKRVVVGGDATAANILAHEATYRAGFAFGLVGNVVYIALTVLFYLLFERVDRFISLLTMLVSLVGCTTQIVAGILELAPLVVLRDTRLAGAFEVAQLRAVALASLKIYSQTFHISFVLFALFDFLLGVLIFRSKLLPRVLGVLMMVAGVVALTFLFPPLAVAIQPFVLAVGAGAEGALMLWLIVKGVNAAPRDPT
jgi:hypothetical protein